MVDARRQNRKYTVWVSSECSGLLRQVECLWPHRNEDRARQSRARFCDDEGILLDLVTTLVGVVENNDNLLLSPARDVMNCLFQVAISATNLFVQELNKFLFVKWLIRLSQ